MRFVTALNAVRDNIWALFIIAAGVVLMLKRQEAVGSSLVTLGAAVFQRGKESEKTQSPTA